MQQPDTGDFNNWWRQKTSGFRRNVPVISHAVVAALEQDRHVARISHAIDLGKDEGGHHARAAAEPQLPGQLWCSRD